MDKLPSASQPSQDPSISACFTVSGAAFPCPAHLLPLGLISHPSGEHNSYFCSLRLLFEEPGPTNRSPPHLLQARNPTGHLLRFDTCDKCTSYEQATDVSFCLANASAIFQLIVNHHWSVNSLLCGLAKLPINQPD